MLLEGPASLGSVTIVGIPGYVLVHFKLNKFLGNDFKGLSLTTVA
jgi:hypothetical protein